MNKPFLMPCYKLMKDELMESDTCTNLISIISLLGHSDMATLYHSVFTQEEIKSHEAKLNKEVKETRIKSKPTMERMEIDWFRDR